MNEITSYRANDGKVFTDKEKCRSYEVLLNKVNTYHSLLGTPPKYHERIKQNPKTIDIIIREVVTLANLKDKIDMNDPFKYRHGIVGRYLDDSGSILNKIWYRLMCIGDDYYEYDQPYFAIHGLD